MSLTSFLEIPDVKEKLKPLRPKLPRKIAAPLKVEPRSNRYAIVGRAFDYLLRFELQRQAPHAVVGPWVVEQVPDKIWSETTPGCSEGLQLDWLEAEVGPRYYGQAALRIANRAREIVEDAEKAVATYVNLRRPNRDIQADVAAHAIRLAYLEDVYRASRLDPAFEVADPEDVEDLLRLLAIVPFDSLIHDSILLLNPNFGEASELIGGADADLITGDMLVDFKTTKAREMEGRFLDQLLGYYLLARHERQKDPTFPEIKRLSLYFCRHGHLWIEEATTWTDHPQFAEVEKWFFERAEELHGRARKVGRL